MMKIPFIGKATCFGVLLLLGILSVPNLSLAQTQGCLVVTPTGSGTKSGADWNNAMAGLPSPMVRGVTYYLAAGTYSGWVGFDVPVNGSTYVTIKKAIPADHCTDVGWNSTTMGGGQAIFPDAGTTGCGNFVVADTANTGYLIVDGQVGSGMNKGSYGIYMPSNFDPNYCNNDPHNIWVGFHGSYTATHIIFRYIEIAGSCGGLAEDSSYYQNCYNITNGVTGVHPPKSDGNVFLYNCTDCVFDHIFIHNSAGTPFDMGVLNNGIQITNSFVHYNMSTPSWHNNVIDSHGWNSNITIANNVVEDTMGTGGIVSLNSTYQGQVDQNWYIYDNIWYQSPTSLFGNSAGYGNGWIACINKNTCTNWQIYQNDIVNMSSIQDGVVFNDGSTGTITVRNNIWYHSQTSSATNVQWVTEDHNSFLAAAVSPSPSGAGDVVHAGASSPFTNWGAGQFTLNADTGDVNNRSSLSAGPWNTDMAGYPFTTDRGAYQFGGSGGLPAPPSSLTVASVS